MKGRDKMDMMSSIAAVSMDMGASALEQQASISVQKKAMDAQEIAAETILKMMPPSNSVIDTYA